MDYQCMFEQNVEGFPYRRRGQWRSQPSQAETFYASKDNVLTRQPIREILFKHFEGHSSVLIEDDFLEAEHINADKLSMYDSGEFARLRFLISPPRVEAKDEYGRPSQYNPEAPNPFDDHNFSRFVHALKFHKAALSPQDLGQVSRVVSQNGVTSFYIENYSYRVGWYKVSVSFDPATMNTSVYLHNLNSYETSVICDRLLSESIHRLTIHPLLVPILVMELLVSICIKELERLFQSSIRTEHTLGLNNNEMFEHFKDFQLDNEAAAERAFGDGQALCALEERMDFTIMMGTKLHSFFGELKEVTKRGLHKTDFEKAGRILRTRLEHLVEGLKFQLPRLRRAQAHTQLNRTGLENRTAAQANKINFHIAQETKADSSAMKAIAVLTMFFLPGTFVAAFFAMPLFNWDAEDQSGILNGRFWIYWAVTVPGTMLVLVVWRLWWLFTYWDQNREVAGESFLGAVKVWVTTWGKKPKEGKPRGMRRNS